MTIKLSDIFPIAIPGSYKLHYARWNEINEPLGVFVRDRNEWHGWHE